MPRSAHQFLEIREQRQAQIMTVALELFARQGFHSTSIANIATEAGISKGLLYNYFDSKEALIRELIIHGFEELFSVFDPDHDGKLIRSEVKFFTIELLEVLKSDTRFWRLYFSMLTQPEIFGLVGDWVMNKAIPIFEMLAEYFKMEGAEDPMTESRLFAAMLDGIAMNFAFDPENFPIDKVRDRFLSLYNLD
jgi:AcrR family transcriptional regulator